MYGQQSSGPATVTLGQKRSAISTIPPYAEAGLVMPLRGETIGTAFVRILADGSGLPESVKDEMERADPVAEAAGTRHSKRYEAAFNKELKKSMPHDLDKVLTESIGRSNAIEDFFNNSPRWQKITKRLEKEFGDAGLVIAHNLSEAVRQGQDLGVIERRLANVNREVLTANRQIITAMRDEEEASTRLAIRLADAHTEAHRMNIEFDRLKKALKDEQKEEPKVFSKSLLGRIEKIGHELDRTGDKVGLAFGKRARNNFLNLFGRGVQSVVETVARLFIGVGKVGDKFAQITSTFKGAGGGIGGIGAVFKDNALAVGKFAFSLTGLVVLLGLIITTAGLVTTILSGVAAAITALAGSVAFGLIGALAPLAGLLPVLIFGVSTLALGLGGLNKAGKKALAESLKPLGKELKSLRAAAASGLFSEVTKQSRLLTPVVAGLKPLFHDIGVSIADVFTSFAKGANSPGFKAFVRSMDTFIPRSIRLLGDITKNVFAGLGALFIQLEPFALAFLRAVDGIARRFADWASSKKGRDEIKDFLGRAATSAGQLVGLLGAAGGLLATLLGGGKDTGDTIIQELTNQLNEWTTELKDPKNKKAIADWFANGKQVAEDLGNIAKSIGTIAKALDSPDNRKFAHQFMTLLTTTFGAAASATHLLDVPFLSLVGTIKFATKHFGILKDAVGTAVGFIRQQIANMVTGILNKFGLLLDGATKALGWIPTIGPALKKARQDFHDWVGRVNDEIAGIHREVHVSVLVKLKKELGAISFYAAQKDSGVITVRGKGGPVWPGKGFLVGENGPEWFEPSLRGRILPNNDPVTQAFLSAHRAANTTTHIDNSRTSTMGGITIVTPTEDPRRVADEVINRLAAAAI